MIEGAATLFLKVDTDEANTAIKNLRTALQTIPNIQLKVQTGEAAQQLKTLNAELDTTPQKIKNVEAALAKGSAGYSGYSKSVSVAASSLGEFDAGVNVLAKDMAALASKKLDLNSIIRGTKTSQQQIEGSVRSLSAYIKKLEEVQGVVNTLKLNGVEANALLSKSYGFDVTTVEKELATSRENLATLHAQAAQRERILGLEGQMVALVAEEKRLEALNVAGFRASELAKELALRDQITQQMVAQAETRRLNVEGTQANELAKKLALESQITQQMVAQAETRRLNVEGTQANELAKKLALERQVTQEMVAQAETRRLNVEGTQANELAKKLALERQVTQENKEQVHWLQLSNRERAHATLQAAKVIYSPQAIANPALIDLAGSGPAIAAARLAGSVGAAEKAYAALGTATKISAGHQAHWNTVANEGHAAIRGLSGSLGALWLTYGSLAPLLAGAALAGSLKSIFTIGKDLEYQFAVVSAISEGATVDISKFNQAVAGTQFTPTEAAQGLRVLAQAGLGVVEATAALPSVLRLATIGETDMGTAALASAAIMHGFGLAVSDFGHIGDVFGKAAAISATSVTGMMAAMRQATLISNLYGVSLEETAGALATLANRGIEGSAAGTAITNMTRELSAPVSDRAVKVLKQYGIEAHNLDGTAKTLTEDIEQLHVVTSTMSERAKADFLGSIFNNRSVKAVGILLNDMEKFKETVEDLKKSSDGLGFTTEASIKLSLSTEGQLKTLASDFQRNMSEVFTGIQPQIQALIGSIASLVNSAGFQEFFAGMAKGVALLSKAFIEHIEVIKDLALAYVGFKGFTVFRAGVAILVPILGQASAALTATTVAAEASAVSMGAAAGGVTLLGGALKGLVALAAPFTLLTAAIAAVGYVIYKAYDALHGMTDEQQAAVEESKNFAQANRTIVTELERGIAALDKDNIALDEQIRLMRMGSTEAEAYARSLSKVPLALAAQNVEKAKLNFTNAVAAQNAVPRVNFGAGIPFVDPYAKERNGAEALVNESQKNLLAAKQSYYETEKSLDAAAGKAKEKATKQAYISEMSEAQAQNARLAAIEKDAGLAVLAIQKGGLSEKAKAAYQAQITVNDKVKKLGLARVPEGKEGGAPVSALATSRLKTELDNLKDDTFQRPRSEGRGHSGLSQADKDAKSILKDTLSSKLKQEQIILSTQLLDLDVKVAAQQLSSVDATEQKNAATLAELNTERDLIKSYIEKAQALGFAVEKEKFINDLAENSEKLRKQEAQSLLDMTKARTADSNALDNIALSTSRYLEDLGREREELGKTTLEVTRLRIERERLRAVEDIKIQENRKEITPVVANAQIAAEEQKAAAKKADEEYRASFVGGWQKATDEYIKTTDDAATTAADLFKKATTSMEDALVELTLTGKLSFKSLADSIIGDIVRMSSKMLVSDLFKMIGFGGNPLVAQANSAPGDALENLFKLLPNAKGNVFNSSSLSNYSNNVYNTPKVFAFAKGAGVFGEAGPEAIMPLTRDAKGRLGVRASNDGQMQAKDSGHTVIVNIHGNNTAADVRRAGGQLGREVLTALSGAKRYG